MSVHTLFVCIDSGCFTRLPKRFVVDSRRVYTHERCPGPRPAPRRPHKLSGRPQHSQAVAHIVFKAAGASAVPEGVTVLRSLINRPPTFLSRHCGPLVSSEYATHEGLQRDEGAWVTHVRVSGRL